MFGNTASKWVVWAWVRQSSCAAGLLRYARINVNRLFLASALVLLPGCDMMLQPARLIPEWTTDWRQIARACAIGARASSPGSPPREAPGMAPRSDKKARCSSLTRRLGACRFLMARTAAA